MYLSFRRSQDALLALGFFVLMVVVVFSTLLYVILFSSCPFWLIPISHRGTLSSVVPGTTRLGHSSTQMATRRSLRSVFVGRVILIQCLIYVHTCDSRYQPQHGTWSPMTNPRVLTASPRQVCHRQYVLSPRPTPDHLIALRPRSYLDGRLR